MTDCQELGPSHYLTLTEQEDDKLWLAEIVDEDPTFRLKRLFLPAYEKGKYLLYDGVYQIHGVCDGITPFNKECCLIHQGKMQRYLAMSQVLSLLPAIKDFEGQRLQRIKSQIRQILAEIGQTADHPLIQENLDYQSQMVDDLDTSEAANACLTQLIKEKDRMITYYTQLLEREGKI